MTDEQLLASIRTKTHDLDKIAINGNDESNLELQSLKIIIKKAIREAAKRGLWHDNTLQWAVNTYVNFYYPNALEEQYNSVDELDSFDKLLITRRSIRHFNLSKPLSKQNILDLINAGRWAPSSCNRQPVRFMVLESKNAKEIAYGIRKDKTILRADKVIAVLVDKRVYNNVEIKYTPYLDSAAAIQNILLKAHELNIGACWINFGLYECGATGLAKFFEKFNLQEYLLCISLIALGYPAKINRLVLRKNIKDIIFWR